MTEDHTVAGDSRDASFYEAQDRPTVRVFYAPKEPTPQKRHENGLHERIRELEAETADLTVRLSERTQELLDVLNEVEVLEDLLIKGAP